jgi:hypothetical protein
MATTYVIQMEDSGTGLTSPAHTDTGFLVVQPTPDVDVTRQIVFEPLNVGVPSGGSGGGGETSVVF